MINPVQSRLRWLVLLPVAWLTVFVAAPTLWVIAVSFATRGAYGGIEWSFQAANYTRAFDPLYGRIFFQSLILAIFTAAGAVAIGFPMALTIATLPSRRRGLAVFALAIPFLTNLVVRIGALKSITAYDGPLAHVLLFLKIQFDPFQLSQNRWLVAYALLTSYLPFAVFPLYAAFERFDFSLIEAARDLGANEWQSIKHILFPSIRPAMSAAFILVFVPALGEFVIPDMLGGAKVMLNGNLISEQFLTSRDWPFGSALAVIFMVLTGLALAISRLVAREVGVRRTKVGADG